MPTPLDDLQRSHLALIDSDSDDSDVIFLGMQSVPASTAGRGSVITDTQVGDVVGSELAPGIAEDNEQHADVGDNEVQGNEAAGEEDEQEEEEEVYVRNPYSRRSISRDGSSVAGGMDPSNGGGSHGDSSHDDNAGSFLGRRSPAASTTSSPGHAHVLDFEGGGRNIRKRPAANDDTLSESDEDLPIPRKIQSGRRKWRITSPSDGADVPSAETPEQSRHAAEPLFLPGPASSPTSPTGSPLSNRIKRSRLTKEPSAVPSGASNRSSRSSSSSASSIGERSTSRGRPRRSKGSKRPNRDPDSGDGPSGDSASSSDAGDTDSEEDSGSADDERTEWDSEDRDDLSSGVDSDAEPETDEDDPILDMNMPETERIIRKRAPDPRPKRKGEGGQVLRPITGAQDLIYTKLPLDPLPAALQHRAVDGNDFCALYEPSLDDTDDEGGCNDDSYFTGANALASRSRVRETDGGLDVAVETDDDEEESRPSQEANGDDALTAALRKRRKQMDDINFQRLCITLAVRYRNGASHSGKALSFLDDAYFNVPWSWLQSKMRYAAGCLERPTWTNVKHDYKDYSELVQDPISFSEHCEGCHRDWQEKCLSYTECTVSGGYDDMTLAPTQREPITIALGTDCRTSFVETFAVYHQVYHSAMGFEKDIFNDERMYPTNKRILRKDVINIDEMVEFLTTCGTPRRTMNTIHRVYSTIKRRRYDWWYDKENNAARQREEIRYHEVRRLRLQEQSLPRRIRGHIVGQTYY